MQELDAIEQRLRHKPYVKNFYRRKKFGDQWLLTTDHGTWVHMSDQEYEGFLHDDITDPLYDDLVIRGILITHENYPEIIKSYYERYKSIESGATLHIIVPTIRCNLRCIYCHSEAESAKKDSSYDMTQETLEQTLSFIFQSPGKDVRIEFQGGEPLLNPSIVKQTVLLSEMFSKRYHKKYSVALVTNLVNLDDDMLTFLVEHQDIITLSSSLDGPPEVHNKNRQFLHTRTGSYGQVTKNLRRCKERGLNVGLLMVTTKHSLPYWKEIIDEYLKWGVRDFDIKPLDYLGYAVNVWQEIGYTIEEFIIFWKKSVDYMFELLEKGELVLERHFHLALNKILYSYDGDFLDWNSPCGTVRGQIVYNYDGDIYCCDEARISKDFVIGNVDSDNYVDLIQKAGCKSLIKASILEGYYCDSCVYKPYCGVCPILHYSQEDNYHIKLNKTNRCQLNRAILDYTFQKVLFDRKQIKKLMLAKTLLRKKDREDSL